MYEEFIFLTLLNNWFEFDGQLLFDNPSQLIEKVFVAIDISQ